MTRVALVEDHALTRTGLRTTLTAAGFDVVAEAADGMTAFDAIAEAVPDVALIDVGLPGRDGIALTRALREAGNTVHVVIFTMHEDDAQVLAALAAGADAYCVKSSDPATVVDAVRTVAAGGAYFDPKIAHVVLRRFSGSGPEGATPLTPRELDVLRLVADGTGNAEIAERLHLGIGTVKGHVRDVLEKLAASDRAHAAVIALRAGYLR